jgi:aminopeptidase N
MWRGGFPELQVTWHWDAARRAIKLRVAQQQLEPAFRFRLPIKVSSGGRVYEQIFEIDEKDESMNLAMPVKPEQIFVNPENTILMTLSVVEATEADSSANSKN